MSEPTSFHDGRVLLHHGDCLDVLDTLPENSVDAACVDPPYHLASIVKRFGGKNAAPAKHGADGAFVRASKGFMSMSWDGGDVAFRPEVWRKVLRVLKPGAYLVAFASTKGFAEMSVAIQAAGFVTHPLLGNLFDGSADVGLFMRSLSAEQAGAFASIIERRDPVAGFLAWVFGQGVPMGAKRLTECALSGPMAYQDVEGLRTGQPIKPCLEPIYLGQKPFSEATGTANVLRWGTGALNVDACRIGTDDVLRSGACELWSHRRTGEDNAARRYPDRGGTNVAMSPGPRGGSPLGRWPAGLMHDGSAAVQERFPESSSGAMKAGTRRAAQGHPGSVCYGVLRGNETEAEIEASSGSVARFFYDYGADPDRFIYQGKAGDDDRLGSEHPTVKDVNLIRWLVRLITPKGGTVIDCFAGTGTTAHAALIEGRKAILIEREAQYVADITRRMSLVYAGQEERKGKLAKQAVDHGPLFGGAA